MEVRALGTSGLLVSQIGLGTMNWGRDTDQYEARDILSTYYEAGGRLIDTADVYGEGSALEILGHLKKDFPDLVVAVKTGAVRTDRRTDLSRKHLIESLDESRKKLNISTIDLWNLHGWDSLTPLDEILSAVDFAISSGRVQYVGLASFNDWQLATTAQRALPQIQLISAQAEYSLLNRKVEFGLIPAAAFHGLGFMAWSPIGRGVLTGKYRYSTPSDSRGASSHLSNFITPYLSDPSRSIVDAVCTAAQGLGVAPLDVALAWTMANPNVCSSIIGPRTAAQLKEILSGTGLELPKPLYEALAEVSN